jgi:hypothetical protein
MSEYQYYEFLALDRPLTAKDQRWLRSLTSRALITSTSLTNTYTWGDFKGNPHELLQRCFDVHLYVANFGFRSLLLKLPRADFDPEIAEAYDGQCGVQVHTYADCTIIELAVDEDPPEMYDERHDGARWMAPLAPLRGDVLNGDLRCLYLTWLLNVQFRILDDETREPPVPPGLGQLSASCETLVRFLNLDRTLVEVAAEASPSVQRAELTDDDYRTHIADLSDTRRIELLQRLLLRDDPELRRQVRQELLSQRTDGSTSADASGPRTVGMLTAEWLRRTEAARQRAKQEAEQARARAVAAAERLRQEHLDRVAKQAASIWKNVDEEIRSRKPRAYDRAVGLLVDLRDAAAKHDCVADYAARLDNLRDIHQSKYSLIRRLDDADLD